MDYADATADGTANIGSTRDITVISPLSKQVHLAYRESGSSERRAELSAHQASRAGDQDCFCHELPMKKPEAPRGRLRGWKQLVVLELVGFLLVRRFDFVALPIQSCQRIRIFT